LVSVAPNWGSSQTHSGDGFLIIGKGHVSTDVSWSHQQPTVISMVHDVAVGAALAVWAGTRDLWCHCQIFYSYQQTYLFF
jgi:hypothetical protein